jgi:trk system potassium uptake protein TrkH
MGWQEAIWPSIFHAISAFCNAGFSTRSDSLIALHNSPETLTVIGLLVILGGLGFVTLEELFQRLFPVKKRLRRLSIHTQLVLTTTAVLIGLGWVFFALFEWYGVLAGLSWVDKLFNALFMSITPRTAGFNAIDYSQASDSTNFLTIILMSIGGSPGSTAGGLKTTTFALLGVMAWSRLRSRPTATFGHRSIPDNTIQRAASLFVIATGIVITSVFALAIINGASRAPQEFLALFFEAVSAFNTVGLSLGVTAELPETSRWVLIFLMLTGRTGPLSIATALNVRLSRRGHYRLAYEDVVVG